MIKSTIAVIALAASAGGAALLLGGIPRFGGGDVAFGRDGTFEVRRGNLRVTIVENGTLVAKESKEVIPDIQGDAKITFLADEGKLVEKGEIVCKLDATELTKQLKAQELELNDADAALRTATTELEIQKIENAAEIEKTGLAVSKAEKEQERYLQGESQQARRKYEVDLRNFQTALSKAKKQYEDSKTLFEQKFVTQTQLDQDKIELERAQVQCDGAELDLKLFDQYSYPLTVMEKDLALRDAKREKETAEKRAENKLFQKQVALDQAKKKLDEIRSQIEEKKTRISKMDLAAPCSCLIIYGDPRKPWITDEIHVGASIYSSYTVVTIPNLDVMQTKVEIHEADINKVKVGQKCKITMDTYEGLVLPGTVDKIATLAGGNNRWMRDDGVKKFAVEITLEKPPDVTLKPGISAKVEILIDELADVVYVPMQSVYVEDGIHRCYVLDEARVPQKRQVKVGLSSEAFIQVLEGLAEKEFVLLYNPNLGDAAPEPGAGAGAAEPAPSLAPAAEAPADGGAAAEGS